MFICMNSQFYDINFNIIFTSEILPLSDDSGLNHLNYDLFVSFT